MKKGELQIALATFFEHDANGPGPKDDVYYLDFKVTTEGSFVQEGSESFALNALDWGEPGNEVFLDTSENPSWYNLTFQPATKDLDIHSGHYIV